MVADAVKINYVSMPIRMTSRRTFKLHEFWNDYAKIAQNFDCILCRWSKYTQHLRQRVLHFISRFVSSLKIGLDKRHFSV